MSLEQIYVQISTSLLKNTYFQPTAWSQKASIERKEAWPLPSKHCEEQERRVGSMRGSQPAQGALGKVHSSGGHFSTP